MWENELEIAKAKLMKTLKSSIGNTQALSPMDVLDVVADFARGQSIRYHSIGQHQSRAPIKKSYKAASAEWLGLASTLDVILMRIAKSDHLF